jgi:hypothetical protein
VGYWIPAKNMTWSVYYPPTDPTGEIVYSLDFARGIDVLRIERSQPAPRVEPPPSQSGSDGPRPNVRVAIDDRVKSVRRGRRVLYRLSVTNTSSTRSHAVEASATVPRELGRVRGGRVSRGVVSFGTKYVSPGRTRTFLFSAQAARRANRSVVEVSARVSARDDVDPRDNYAVDRDRLLAYRRGKTAKASAGRAEPGEAEAGGAAAGSPPYDAAAPENARREARITARTSAMPATEPLALPVASDRAWVATFGSLCRSPLG